MPHFSADSLSKLDTCHPDLRRLFGEIIKYVDCTILEGVRSPERQAQLYRELKTKTFQSKHLRQADGYAHAVDVMAWPIDWNDAPRNYLFAGFVRGAAAMMGIEIRVGADWDGDMTATDQTLHDLPHVERVKG